MMVKSIKTFRIIKFQERSHGNCKLVIVSDSVLKKGENYYQQVCLRECNIK